MKRFGKFRDPRFALTTLQNPTWEVRTRAELIQAAQDALEHQPDAAELPFAARPAAPIIPPPATTIPTPAIEPPLADARRQAQLQSEPEPELQSQPEVRPVPSTVPDVAPIPRPLPKVVAKGSAKRTRNSKPQPKRQPQPVHLSKIIAGTDAAEFVAEALDRHAKKAAGPHRNEPSKLPDSRAPLPQMRHLPPPRPRRHRGGLPLLARRRPDSEGVRTPELPHHLSPRSRPRVSTSAAARISASPPNSSSNMPIRPNPTQTSSSAPSTPAPASTTAGEWVEPVQARHHYLRRPTSRVRALDATRARDPNSSNRCQKPPRCAVSRTSVVIRMPIRRFLINNPAIRK